jgi:hypothetical protein
MERVVELELWSAPLVGEVPFEGKIIAATCRQSTGLPEDVVLGLSFVPDQTDVENLRLSLERAEVSLVDFQQYCARNGLPPDANNISSAAQYLSYVGGQPLAWLHFPASQEGRGMAKVAIEWANENGYLVKLPLQASPIGEGEANCLWQ